MKSTPSKSSSPAPNGRRNTNKIEKANSRVNKAAPPKITQANVLPKMTVRQRLQALRPSPVGIEVAPGRFFQLVPASHGVANAASQTVSNPARLSFLDIPPEIRLMIYRDLLISDKAIDIDWECPRLHPQIMQTCKIIFREAHPVLYDENTWRIRMSISTQMQRDGARNRPSPMPKLSLSSSTIGDSDPRDFIDRSYFNNVFPKFIMRGRGMNPCPGGRIWVQPENLGRCPYFPSGHLFENEKHPRYLEAVMYCATLTAPCSWDIDVMARSLERLPEIRSLTLKCEGTMADSDFWGGYIGTRLRKKLLAYLSGRVRGVKAMTTVGMPEDLATQMTREMTSSAARNRLLLMWDAFERWRFKQCAKNTLTTKAKVLVYEQILSDAGHWIRIKEALERNDAKDFLHYRQLELQRLKDIDGLELRFVEDVYKNDAGDGAEGQEASEESGRPTDMEMGNFV
ncbi:hypothetical protein QBC34DRAFT_430162 [Podospora aff. communis PSN243]|uniref:F-box domain-containing protein n=1 Tax=Podospora aff. communis PSN243 TaxID=3040156 RepID=A0AAV9G8H4_9PEZI|nr:hypothetical protein QBC34DRAFT_430162 [Podospora aff. communis PSN243]